MAPPLGGTGASRGGAVFPKAAGKQGRGLLSKNMQLPPPLKPSKGIPLLTLSLTLHQPLLANLRRVPKRPREASISGEAHSLAGHSLTCLLFGLAALHCLHLGLRCCLGSSILCGRGGGGSGVSSRHVGLFRLLFVLGFVSLQGRRVISGSFSGTFRFGGSSGLFLRGGSRSGSLWGRLL